ncbi:leucine--tRNA ligase [Buchnera aphidicola (Hyadaphis tataricae)]|uniref:Leucine--tRNA ligase n=1 Tax=Buchnera aphidicola (Hyadaphis tataricae) TaxID=1241859 RepID=A0A4D6XZT6_9GAMM|nr:leucine--tRNA ligase [Buchnera aphidicola]QCI21729.1 leucine--tRNA ligase [Buchnera aphidicola (Hyadaphis tataricae)]
MKKQYHPKKIENYVQKFWHKNKTFQVIEDTKKEKYYCLPMLPYPSGKLHIGHVRNYTISDVISRYHRMLGKNVLQPMGWDAFGLPAEEAAIQNNTAPSNWTKNNIEYMKKQLQSLGFSYDWSREITTCQPEYYKWEQWFFIKLYEKKLVYKKKSFVNWCSYDNTVLANEQVVNGRCWRCHGRIKFKKISQWFLKIRNYAESLYQDLKKLIHWPENVKNMQKNWIGRTKGFEITLNIFKCDKKIQVFTDRLDLIMEVTHIVISTYHEISTDLYKENKKIKTFINNYNNLSPEESEQLKYDGIKTEIFAVHPLTEQKIPIWISNFILKEYGTHSMFSIPENNEHHSNFAAKHKLTITNIITILNKNQYTHHTDYIEKKDTVLHSKKLNNLHTQKNTEKIKHILIKKNIIKKKIHYKLQDWCISRQRFWGAPIPMAQLKNGETIPIPKNHLPVLLPEININIDSLKNKIQPDVKWTNVFINNQEAIRETDTFDTFMESSWYYARYTCPHFHEGMIDPKSSKYWLPVDQYVGGIEHAIMHLIYFRFYHKLLRDFKLVSFDEPVKHLLCQGMVLAETFYQIKKNGAKKWLNTSLVLKKRNAQGKIVQSYDQTGKEVIYAGMMKMSKSKNNGIDPELIIKKYGADAIRLFIMFAAPIESSLEWQESGLKGTYRFLNKLWILIFNYVDIKNTHIKMNFNSLNEKQIKLRYQLHKTIQKVSDDMGRRKTFNTAISEIMKLVNEINNAPIETEQDKSIMKESLTCIIKMLYPFTPHFCFVTWQYFNENNSIDEESWPIFDETILLKTYKIIVIQINGKKRDTMKVDKDLTEKEIFLRAKKQIKITQYLKNVTIKKTIYISNKIINFVC